MIFRFTWMEHYITYFSSDQLLSLHYFPGKIFPVDILSYQYKIYNRTIFAPCKIASEINTNKIAQTINHFFDYPVNTRFFHNNIMNIIKQRMIGICLKDLFIAFAQ